MTAIDAKESGFTFIEIIICLIILGFIGPSIGSGLIQSTELYRISKTTDIALPQLDVAYNIIYQSVKDGNDKFIEQDGEYIKYKGNTILGNINQFSIKQSPISDNTTGNIKTIEIIFNSSLNNETHSFIFDVYKN